MINGSKTYIGIIVAVLPSLLGLFGVSLVPGATDQITELLSEMVTIAGAIYAFYGRAKAYTPGFLADTPPIEPKA